MEEIGNWIWVKVVICDIAVPSGLLGRRGSCDNLLLKFFQTAVPQRRYQPVLSGEGNHRLFLTISLLCMGINIALALYAAVILPYVLRV
jgi:hypothetical protein